MPDDRDKELLTALSWPLALEACPYARIAERAGVSEAEVRARLRAWIEDGTIRRFGARVNHRALGVQANGMSVWQVPEDRVEAVGEIMAARREVSHCYERPTRPGWPYNMYAMIHGATREKVLAVAHEIADAAGIDSYEVLFSTREFTKRAPRLFPQPSDTE